jgi:hypothetical protein
MMITFESMRGKMDQLTHHFSVENIQFCPSELISAKLKLFVTAR